MSGVIAAPWGPRKFRVALAIAGSLWLTALGATAVSKRLEGVTPAIPRFLLQCSCLFPRAAEFSISYHIEAYSCDVKKFVPFDHRPYFPIRADDKESVFYRLGFFYRSNHEVMTDLDRALVEEHNRRADGADGVSGPIGGIRLLSLRVPLPPVGTEIQPYSIGPLNSYPADSRQTWYITSIKDRHTACTGAR